MTIIFNLLIALRRYCELCLHGTAIISQQKHSFEIGFRLTE